MQSSEQLAALGRVLGQFETAGIESWVFGGWAVDFHVGAVTRAHADLDLAVWAADVARVSELLEADGWSSAPEEGEDGYTGFERDGVRLELAFLAVLEDGRVCTPLRDGFASWPAGAFGGEIGELEGVRARVIGLDALREEKAIVHDDPGVAAKDRADLARLGRTCDDPRMADTDADRQSFRAHARRLTIYPDGIADTVIEGSEDPRWAFFLVFGSTARGDGTQLGDIDLYAEPVQDAHDAPWVLHFRDRMQAYNVDFLTPPDGVLLADRLAAGDEFAQQLLREALVLSDRSNVIDALRDRYL